MTEPTFLIRPARNEDADALLSLENECFETDRLSLRSLRQLIDSPSACVLVCAEQSQAAGSGIVLLRKGSPKARIYSLAVSHPYRRRGLAAQLMSAAEHWARGQLKSDIHLEVRANNQAALGLYARLGYSATGRRESYYADGEDALALTKSLGHPLRRREDTGPRASAVGYLSAGYYRSLIAEAHGLVTSPTTAEVCDSWLPAQPERQTKPGQGIAILHDPDDRESPANLQSHRFFIRLANRHGVEAKIISPGDIHRLPEFGALWIRSHTSPRRVSYVFARRAEALGLPVIDSPGAIRYCGNKVFIAERLRIKNVPQPRFMILDEAASAADVESQLSYPIVLKVPDGAFSKSVARAYNRAALEMLRMEMANRSHILLAQEYIPTKFDWRIGVLDGEVMFACQYRMVRGHWQIVKHRDAGPPVEGQVRAVSLSKVPAEVLEAACAASRAMGPGLHGVDLKTTANGVYVIEVNDNPDLHHGFEDRAEGDLPWLKLLAWFQQRQAERLLQGVGSRRPAIRHGRAAPEPLSAAHLAG